MYLLCTKAEFSVFLCLFLFPLVSVACEILCKSTEKYAHTSTSKRRGNNAFSEKYMENQCDTTTAFLHCTKTPCSCNCAHLD